jgi:hypothetical protein
MGMLAMIPGEYAPVPVQDGDLVGYSGTKSGFVLLNPREERLGLPTIPAHLSSAPILIRCEVSNNQRANLFSNGSNMHGGRNVTLHDICGRWFYRIAYPDSDFNPKDSNFKPLAQDTFLEIGWQ